MPDIKNMVHIIQQAVQDYNNSDNSNTLLNLQDLHPNIQSCVMMTKTCFLEFDPMNPRSKLPACLTRNVGSFIGNYVILEDPNKNHIQVSIERKNAKIYFTRGWSFLRNFYSIGLGGWVTLLYINPFLFQPKVWKITGIEVTYPKKSPSYKLMLLEQSSEGSSSGPVPYFVTPKTFCHAVEKVLTSTDVELGVLKLSWDGFCEAALPKQKTELKLLDWFRYKWKCRLELEDNPPKTCQIVGQWRSICKTRKLIEGVTLKLGVTKPSNNTVIHLKISPFIGVRTTLIAPTVSGGHKGFYQAEQYFML